MRTEPDATQGEPACGHVAHASQRGPAAPRCRLRECCWITPDRFLRRNYCLFVEGGVLNVLDGAADESAARFRAAGNEDVLVAVVVDRFGGESPIESSEPQTRDVE